MRLTKKAGAGIMFAGGVGCAIFAYLAVNDGDPFAMWANALTAAYCLAFGLRLWRQK